MSKRFSFLKVYFLIATLVGLFGMIIAYGMALYAGLEYMIITDQEYTTSREFNREIQHCNQQAYPKQPVAPESMPLDMPTQENIVDQDTIDQCIENARTRMIQARRIEMKTTLLQGTLRGSIFLILFIIHYPRFKQED